MLLLKLKSIQNQLVLKEFKNQLIERIKFK